MSDKPTVEIVKELSDLTLDLVKKEVDLAKAELEKRGETYVTHAKALSGSVFLFAGAGFAGVYALVELLNVILIQGLAISPAVALWLSPLLVAVALGTTGWFVWKRATRKFSQATLIPQHSIKQIEEDIECLTN